MAAEIQNGRQITWNCNFLKFPLFNEHEKHLIMTLSDRVDSFLYSSLGKNCALPRADIRTMLILEDMN